MLRITLALLLLAAMAVGAVAAWGLDITGGPHVVRTRPAAPFHAVVVRGSADVKLVPGRSPTLTVSGPRRRVDDITTEVRNGVLVVGHRDHRGLRLDLSRTGATVVAHAPALATATVNGSGSVSGARLRGATCAARVHGSGAIAAAGRCDQLSGTVDGSGDLTMSGVHVLTATMAVSGSGDAAVDASQSLHATVDGSGDVHDTTRPDRLLRDVDGSGEVDVPGS